MSAPLDRATMLGGGSVRVVLYPDPNRPEVTATVENLALPHLYIQENKVIGVSGYNHSWHLNGARYDPRLTAAYAYSNFCDLVFNASLALGVVRGIHVSLYSKIRFVVVPDFEEIWRLDGNGGVESVRDAVRAGRKLKVAIEDDSGLTVVHPVHMAEVLLDRHEFTCFTDQTAHPAIFRAPDAIQAMSNEIAGRLLEAMRAAATVDFSSATQFDISSPIFDPPITLSGLTAWPRVGRTWARNCNSRNAGLLQSLPATTLPRKEATAYWGRFAPIPQIVVPLRIGFG